MQHRQPDLAAIKERQQRAWASGDYAMFGATLLIMSELLCEAVDVRPDRRFSTWRPAAVTPLWPPPAASER